MSAELSKQELLDSIYDITRKTGQGVPMIVLKQKLIMERFVNELLEQKYIKSYTLRYNYLPDDVCVVPAGNYYCFFEDENPMALTYMRIYLGHNDVGFGITPEDVLKEKKDDYEQWLKLNKNQLKKLTKLKNKKISKKHLESIPLKKEYVSYFKRLGFYQNNVSVRESIQRIEELLSRHYELLKLYVIRLNKMLQSYQENAVSEKDSKLNKSLLSKYKKEVEETNEIIVALNEVSKRLQTEKEETLIQKIIK